MKFFRSALKWIQNFKASNSSDLIEIYAIRISKDRFAKKTKALTLVSTSQDSLNSDEIFIEIRSYNEGVPIDTGVYLTENEYNWMIKKLTLDSPPRTLYAEFDESSLSTSNLKVEYKLFGKVKLSQKFKAVKKSITLAKKERYFLISNCKTFYIIAKTFSDSLKDD